MNFTRNFHSESLSSTLNQSHYTANQIVVKEDIDTSSKEQAKIEQQAMEHTTEGQVTTLQCAQEQVREGKSTKKIGRIKEDKSHTIRFIQKKYEQFIPRKASKHSAVHF